MTDDEIRHVQETYLPELQRILTPAGIRAQMDLDTERRVLRARLRTTGRVTRRMQYDLMFIGYVGYGKSWYLALPTESLTLH